MEPYYDGCYTCKYWNYATDECDNERGVFIIDEKCVKENDETRCINHEEDK